MKSPDNEELTETEISPTNPTVVESDLDSEFENEELGERQPEACSMEDGCLSCE